jgi:hypothetical protein
LFDAWRVTNKWKAITIAHVICFRQNYLRTWAKIETLWARCDVTAADGCVARFILHMILQHHNIAPKKLGKSDFVHGNCGV